MQDRTRLVELKNISYEEYVETPEWSRRQRSALKQAGYRCQMCGSTGVHLEVHHTTDKHFGCEQEVDLVILCEDCFERLATPRDEVEVPFISLGQKALIFGATAGVSTVGIEGILHAPLPMELVALIGAFVLARQSPQLYAMVKQHLPDPVKRIVGKATEREVGEWSWWDKFAHARHLQGDPPLVEDEERNEDTVVEALPPVFPRYKEDETLRLGQAIDNEALAVLASAHQQDPSKRLPKVAGRRFEPHINALFGRSMILAAVQGSGKSMLNGLYIEQAGECDSPSIMFDHKGEYTGIAELSYLSGLIAGGESAQRKADRIGASFFALTPANAYDFVEMVLEQHLQAIVVLPSYGPSWLARASVVASVALALQDYAENKREQEEHLVPCLVFLDEVQLYLPERAELLPPEAKRNGQVLDTLYNAFFSLVSNGRSNGYTMCFATQSLTYIGKWAIKSCQIKVLMRHVEYNDLEMISRSIKGIVNQDEIVTMPPGVGVVIGFTPKPMLVQFDSRKSRDDSETPGVERLREARTTEPTATRSVKVGDLSLDELVALVTQKVRPGGSDEEPNTEGLENGLEEISEKQTAIAYVPPPRVLRPVWKYEEYYAITKEAYRVGYTGKRKLADFIRLYGKSFEVGPVGNDKALAIINEMRERGMLKDEGQDEEEKAHVE